MYLTTANIGKHLHQLYSEGYEIRLLAVRGIKDNGWHLRLIPTYEGEPVNSEALLLFTGHGEKRKPKQLKSTLAVFNFATRWEIDHEQVSFE